MSHNFRSESHHWQLSEIISWLCRKKKNQQEAVNHLEGYCGRDSKVCHFTSPWHVPVLHSAPVSGTLQQSDKGNRYGEGEGAQGFRLPGVGSRKPKRVSWCKVYKNMDAVDELKEAQFAKHCRTRSRENW